MTSANLEILAEYAEKLKTAKQEKLNLEIKLAQVEAQIKALEETMIPDQMLAGQVNSIKIAGVQMDLKKGFSGGISFETADKAAKILTDHGYQFNWVTNIKIPGPKYVAARKMLDQVTKCEGLPDIQAKPDIHHATFKKICKELDDKGELSDETIKSLGVVVQHVAATKILE